MSQLKLSFQFINSNSTVVPELSKDMARPDDIMAALAFMQDGCSLVVKVDKVDIGADK